MIDDSCWLQRCTHRTPRSMRSKVNREKVDAFIEQGQMRASGMAEVERAKADGRWDAAYAGSKTATVLEDLAVALAASPAQPSFSRLSTARTGTRSSTGCRTPSKAVQLPGASDPEAGRDAGPASEDPHLTWRPAEPGELICGNATVRAAGRDARPGEEHGSGRTGAPRPGHDHVAVREEPLPRRSSLRRARRPGRPRGIPPDGASSPVSSAATAACEGRERPVRGRDRLRADLHRSRRRPGPPARRVSRSGPVRQLHDEQATPGRRATRHRPASGSWCLADPRQ